MNEHRGAVNAATAIINNGLQFFFNQGVKFGFYEDDDDTPKEVGQNIYDLLLKYKETELAKTLKRVLDTF